MSTMTLFAADRLNTRTLAHISLRPVEAEDKQKGAPALDEAIRVLKAQDHVCDGILSNIIAQDAAAADAATRLPDLRASKGTPVVFATGAPDRPDRRVIGFAQKPRL